MATTKGISFTSERLEKVPVTNEAPFLKSLPKDNALKATMQQLHDISMVISNHHTHLSTPFGSTTIKINLVHINSKAIHFACSSTIGCSI